MLSYGAFRGAFSRVSLLDSHSHVLVIALMLTRFDRPVVGGFAAQYKNWRWTQWCMLFVAIAVFLTALPMKETYKPAILKKRAKKLGIALPTNEAQAVKRSLVQNFLRPLHMLVTEVSYPFWRHKQY